MKTWQRSYYEENIGTTYQATILELLNGGLLPVLNLFKCLKEDMPDKLEEVIATLQQKLLAFIPEQIESASSAELVEAFPDLKDYPVLLQRCKLAILSVNNLFQHANDPLETEVVRKIANFPRSRTVLVLAVQSLTSVLPRSEVVAYCKTNLHRIYPASMQPDMHVESLKEHIQAFEGITKQFKGHNLFFFQDKGYWGCKVTRCRNAENMKDLNDPELCDASICHKNFPHTKLRNENFVLTRTQTLMAGQDYCDYCFHDLRVVKTAEHPPKEFWDSLK